MSLNIDKVMKIIEVDEEEIEVDPEPSDILKAIYHLLVDQPTLLPMVRGASPVHSLEHEAIGVSIADQQEVPLETQYDILLEMLRDLPTLHRRFFLKVLADNLELHATRWEDVCLFLTGHTPSIAAHICGEIKGNWETLDPYLEKHRGFLIVRREIWKRLMGEAGERGYESYKRWIENLIPPLKER